MSLDEDVAAAKRKVQDSLPDMLRLAIELNRGGNATLLSALAETFGIEKLVGPDIPKPDHQVLDLAKVIDFVRERLGEKPEAYERAFAELHRKHGLGIMHADWGTEPFTRASLFDQSPGPDPLSVNDLERAITAMQAQTSPRFGVPDRPSPPSLFMSADMATQLRNTIQEQEASQPPSSEPGSNWSDLVGRANTSLRGIEIIASEACPENTVYLINPNAVNARSREELARMVARMDGRLEDR